jgi:hypothetical protein
MTDQERADNVVKWIKALKSGDFRQGQGLLSLKDGSYCCLGVAAIVLKKGYGEDDTGLDKEDQDSLGLNLDAQDSLIALNDEHGNTFTEIAEDILNPDNGILVPNVLGLVKEQMGACNV